MLQSLKYSGAPSPTIPGVRRITGGRIARANGTRQERAQLATDLVAGSAVIYPLQVNQAAALCGVPPLDVPPLPRHRPRQHPPRQEPLAAHILRSSLAERLAAAHAVGVAVIWDTFISPVIDAERAAADNNITA